MENTDCHKEGANVPTFCYYGKPVHVSKDCQKRTKEEKQSTNKNEDNKNKSNCCKINNNKEKDFYKKGRHKSICEKHHRRCNLRRAVYREIIKPRS